MMTKNLLSTTFLSSILALGTTVFLASVSQAIPIERAMDINFICDTDASGTPTTYAVARDGNSWSWRKPIIRWRSQYFSRNGNPPQVRCERVSGRFNELLGANTNDSYGQYEQYNLTLNQNRTAVCLVAPGLSCENGILFTLRPDEKARAHYILWSLVEIRDGASGVLEESENDVEISINLNRLLESIPSESIDPSNENSSPNSPPSQPSDSSPSEEIW